MLDANETTLIDGHLLRQIGNEFVVLDENGMQVGKTTRSETLAIKRLTDHRVSYAQAQHSPGVLSAASRYMNALAWLKHLEHCEEERDEDAIDRAKCQLTAAEIYLDQALADAGDKYARKRLSDRVQAFEEAA